MDEERAVLQKRDAEDRREQPTILVVDDDIAICDVIHNYLEGMNYPVRVCSDPHDALSLLSREPVDLVLTDLQMGEVSGVDILRAARQYQADTAVILITGFPTVENAVQVLKEGAYDYITKPFQLDELGKVVQRALEQQRLAREVVSLRDTVSLYQISEDMSSSLELSELLEKILGAAVEEVQSEYGCILLLDDRRERLRVGAMRGLPPWDCEAIERLAPRAVRAWIERHDPLRPPLRDGDRRAGRVLPCRSLPEGLDSPCPLWVSPDEDASCLCVPLRAKDQIIGVLHVSRSSRTRRYGERDLKALAILAGNAARAIENARLYSSLYQDYHSFIEALAQAVDAKDSYSRKHSYRVAFYSQVIGYAFNLSVPDMENLEVASMLHDIGKIGIPDQILCKPSGLTREEFAEMQEHPKIGERILKPIESLKEVRRWIYQHHERFDGGGYPEGIRGDDIDFQARILIVAEVYDALVTQRAYKKAWPVATALDYLRDHSGSHFDPEVIGKFTDVLARQGKQLAEFVQTSHFRRYSCNDLEAFFQDGL